MKRSDKPSEHDKVAVLVLAAGKGTRLKSRLPKVLHEVGGKPLLAHVIAAAAEVVPVNDIYIVIGHEANRVHAAVESTGVNFVLQADQRGTGHALMVAESALAAYDHVITLPGDAPLITPWTIGGLLNAHLEERAAMTLLTADFDNPTGYGRVVRKSSRSAEVLAIVEEKSASPAQKRVREINAGSFVFAARPLFANIGKLSAANPHGEYYLTDMAEILRQAKQRVVAWKTANPGEVLDSNTRAEMFYADLELSKHKVFELLGSRVTLVRPDTCIIDQDVQVGVDTIIRPFAQLLGATKVGADCDIGSFNVIVNRTIADRTVVAPSYYKDAAQASALMAQVEEPNRDIIDEWDVFVSHASEDKNAIARPLAEKLRAKGLRVWYDEFTLTVGDSLHRKIDEGLTRSRFGVVILSPHFFEKHWPEQELNALATREVDGKKVILPVWHEVGFKQVQSYSPILADRIAVNTNKGLPHVVKELLLVISLPNSSRNALSASETMGYVRDLEAQLDARGEELQAAKSELERSYDLTLQTLGDAIDLRNAETEGHSKRVTAFTIAIARAMGVPREQILVIARGVFLHDVGKIEIPDTILRKPGKLTEEERNIMRDHTRRGYEMLKKIPFLTEASEIVYSHQEHFDGSGYPRGLKGKEIPLGARIFSITDTLDAITSDRPYRLAKPAQAAREEIKKWSGRQFDSDIVKVFLSIPEKLWKDLRDEIDST